MASPPKPGIDATELFEILVREQESRLRAFIGSMVSDPESVNDLVQEAFLIAWKNLSKYDRTLPFGPWLRGIAKNLARSHFRKVQRDKHAFPGEEIIDHLSLLYSSLDQAPGDIFEDQVKSLEQCLEKLPDHQRRIIDLHYEENLDTRQIAEFLGRTREGVKKILQRGRSWLGDCIQQRLSALGIEPVRYTVRGEQTLRGEG